MRSPSQEVTVCETIITENLFVMNSTEYWPDWEKVVRPDDKDLADHPLYHTYFKECDKRLSRPTATIYNRSYLLPLKNALALEHTNLQRMILH